MHSLESSAMNRKLLSLAGVLVAVFSVASQAQVAEAQFFGGQACCGQVGYSGYSAMNGHPYVSYGGYPYAGYPYGGSGCGTGCGYGATRTYSIAPTGCCGTSSYGSTGCGTGRCGLGYGSGISGVGLYGGYELGGCGLGRGCYSGYQGYGSCGCRPRYRRACSVCCQSSGFTGASATCCQPAPTCCGTMSGGYTVQPGPATPVPTPATPTPTLNPAPSAAPMPSTDPAPATAPTPGT